MNHNNSNISSLNNTKTPWKGFVDSNLFKNKEYHKVRNHMKFADKVENLYNKFKQITRESNEFLTRPLKINNEMRKFDYKQEQKKHMVLALSLLIMLYFATFSFISYRKRVGQSKRVEEASKKYEFDKHEYINTGVTR